MWDVSLCRIAEHPWFGVGLGTFGGTSAFMFGYSRLWVDNFYLQMARRGRPHPAGRIPLASVARGQRIWWPAIVRARDPFLRALTVGAFGSFIAVVVANLTAECVGDARRGSGLLVPGWASLGLLAGGRGGEAPG